jgi:hypothetical protein
LATTTRPRIGQDTPGELSECLWLARKPTLIVTTAALCVVDRPPLRRAVVDYVLLAKVAPVEVVAAGVDTVLFQELDEPLRVQLPGFGHYSISLLFQPPAIFHASYSAARERSKRAGPSQ